MKDRALFESCQENQQSQNPVQLTQKILDQIQDSDVTESDWETALEEDIASGAIRVMSPEDFIAHTAKLLEDFGPVPEDDLIEIDLTEYGFKV